VTRVALVTGASRGIGRSVAEHLAAAGFHIGLMSRDTAALAEVEAALTESGATAARAAADVTDGAAVRAAVDAIEDRLGGIDLLVNNAGVIDSAEVGVSMVDPDDWWRVIEVNLRGPLLVSHAVLPGLRERGGRIVNITGMVLRAVPGYSAYCASKAALNRLTESLAQDDVLAFDLSPGTVLTDMTAGMPMMRGGTFATIDRAMEFILAIADGKLDALSGRYFHAQRDDLPEILARAKEVVDTDARRLRMAPYAATDPVILR
jgi:NAD(P)-dependent dehydrogenase (short-subunit alcohol dehydrogenase family)